MRPTLGGIPSSPLAGARSATASDVAGKPSLYVVLRPRPIRIDHDLFLAEYPEDTFGTLIFTGMACLGLFNELG